VIGSLAKIAAAMDVQTVVSSGDKDMVQLIGSHVTLVNTMSNERLDDAGVRAKFGVGPDRIVDYLTLVGDPVDNVPGVDKVGPKTAARWLAQYGSLDGVLAHAGSITGAVGENLRKALDWLPTARQLVTIRTDCELPAPLEALTRRDPDRHELARLFERFGFRTWLRELQTGNGSAGGATLAATAGDGGAAAPDTAAAGPADPARPAPAGAADDPGEAGTGVPVPPERHYETLFSEADLRRWLDRIEQTGLVALDTETTSLDPMAARLVGMSFSTGPGIAAYLPLAHDYAGAPEQLGAERALALLRPWLESPSRRKVGQNIKYDQHVLANHGVALRGVAEDTVLQSYVLESHVRHDLDSLAARWLNESTLSYDQVTGTGAKRISFSQVEVARAATYAAEDADITLRIERILAARLEREPGLARVYREIELPVREVLFRMERTGVLIDAEALAVQSRELSQKMIELEQRAHAEAGQPFNLNSPRQIGEIFFEQLKLPVVKKTATGVPSTDEEVLEKLALDYPLPKTLLEYRGVAKLKSTYTDKLPKMVNPATGRVHTNYGQVTAVTGRLASTDPNLQNIPIRTAEGRRIREAFIAPPGAVIVSADYSQIELRIMAHLSGDAGLLAAFAAGEDIHRATAAEIFNRSPAEVSSEERRYAKVINFGLIYGMSAFGLAQQLGIERATAKAYIDSYFTRYPGVARYMEETRQSARERGFVETVFGRRLWLPDIASGNPARRAGAERAAINAPMQGTAADLIKLAMVAVQDWLDREALGTRLVMQVHDELVLEVPAAERERVLERIPALMSSVGALRVPLVAEIGAGSSWEQAH